MTKFISISNISWKKVQVRCWKGYQVSLGWLLLLLLNWLLVREGTGNQDMFFIFKHMAIPNFFHLPKKWKFFFEFSWPTMATLKFKPQKSLFRCAKGHHEEDEHHRSNPRDQWNHEGGFIVEKRVKRVLQMGNVSNHNLRWRINLVKL